VRSLRDSGTSLDMTFNDDPSRPEGDWIPFAYTGDCPEGA